MGQKKLQRFEAIRSFGNVLEYPVQMAGRWKEFFNNPHMLTLELACGKGEYALGLGRLYPDRNFIGIDLKGNRIWVGAKKALAEGLKNVAFIRSQIDKTDNYFEPGEVAEIWITFPDPQLRTSRAKKRLTHPHFLRVYQRYLKPGGMVHLKTDSPDLFQFTKIVAALYNLTILEENTDLYSGTEVAPELQIRTYYESLDIAGSNRIFYIRLLLDSPLPLEKDRQLKEIIVEQETARRGV